MKLRRFCFYTCLSYYPQGACLVGGVPGPVGCLLPGGCLVWGAWSGGPGLGVPGLGGCLHLGEGAGSGGVYSQGGGAWSGAGSWSGGAWWGLPGPRGFGGVGIPACTEADPPGRGYCCRWYASYWNTFFLN